MPRLSTNYDNTCIYKIVCKDLNITDCYVGQTTNFRKRKWHHKSSVNKLDFKIYKFIRENGGWDNWDMIEIEKYPCNDGNEARTRERYWYEELKATLNTETPNQSQKEYKKIYRQTEQFKSSAINYIKTHPPPIEKKREWNRNSYHKNKDIILEKNKVKEVCVCGCIISHNNMYRHFRTDKHKNYLTSIVVGV